MQATITDKGQITIPIEIRKRLNLQPGQRLEFDERAPFLKAMKVIDRGRMDLARGALGAELANISILEAIEGLRGPVDSALRLSN